MLGLGRAVGETMAVVMVIGNTPKISTSLLQPGYSMPALLANQFNESYNDPMQLSALLEIALILFAFTFILNAAARLLIRLLRAYFDGDTTWALRQKPYTAYVTNLTERGSDPHAWRAVHAEISRATLFVDAVTDLSSCEPWARTSCRPNAAARS